MTPQTVARQALSPWNSPGKNTGVGFPSPGDLPNLRIEPRIPALWADSSLPDPPGKKTGSDELVCKAEIETQM